jgi:hypothetical protein
VFVAGSIDESNVNAVVTPAVDVFTKAAGISAASATAWVIGTTVWAWLPMNFSIAPKYAADDSAWAASRIARSSFLATSTSGGTATRLSARMPALATVTPAVRCRHDPDTTDVLA